MQPPSIDAPEKDATARILEARRRVRDGYYDRIEVRRILCGIILRRLTKTNAPGDREHPDSA